MHFHRHTCADASLAESAIVSLVVLHTMLHRREHELHTMRRDDKSAMSVTTAVVPFPRSTADRASAWEAVFAVRFRSRETGTCYALRTSHWRSSIPHMRIASEHYSVDSPSAVAGKFPAVRGGGEIPVGAIFSTNGASIYLNTRQRVLDTHSCPGLKQCTFDACKPSADPNDIDEYGLPAMPLPVDPTTGKTIMCGGSPLGSSGSTVADGQCWLHPRDLPRGDWHSDVWYCERGLLVS